MLTNDEIIALMSKPMTSARINQYKAIWQLATGKPWKGCMCGNAMDRLFQMCKNYSNNLIKNNV